MSNLNPVPQDKGSLIRTIVLAIALINQLLAVYGYSPLPIDDSNAELIVSTVFASIAAVVAWWKNNNLTRKARQADELARQRGLKK